MATLQNIGVLKYRDKDGNWKPLPVVLQSSGGGGSGGISTISGNGQPTASTVGRLNQLYRDELTDKLYICTGEEGGYTWAAVVSDTEDAVTYTAQTLTDEQKTQARANIGAGTSNFSGLYNDLPDKPNIPAATVIDTTLTKSGQAADSKAAGDAIAQKLDATALPTAINDALAQAKASGAFDGAKGEKGDPGAPGIRGEKGADGKDGAGMDVTGAKVGQIAKITAVDSAGKPTAWGPVDMPSGEDDDTFELINTIELTESANFIQISQDANGNALSLKEAYIVCVSVFVTDDTDNVFTSIKIKVNGKAATNNTSPKFETKFPRYTAAYAKIVPQETILAGIESSGFNANWDFGLESMGRLNDVGSTITSIELNPNDGLKCIGSAGTKVYLYGVRS